MVKIYSHPRSGTHFLMELVASNFYFDKNLETNNRIFGHWSRLRNLEDMVKNGALFGSHSFALRRHRFLPIKKIYIYRDGRDVAFSMWNSKFYDKAWGDITFSEYIRKDIDWFSTPTFKSSSKRTILQHWEDHVVGWLKTNDRFILKLRYEEVLADQEKTVKQIAEFLKRPIPSKIKAVNKLVGLAPNKGKIHKWKDHLTEADHEYITNVIPNGIKWFWNHPKTQRT